MEPDLGRAMQIRKHVRANGLISRVDVLEAAAAVQNGQAKLSASGSSSRIGDQGAEVALLDLLEMLAARPAEVIKMDIEGSEYAILGDRRFEAVCPRVLILEWHKTPEHPDGYDWCCLKLQELGYRVVSESGKCPWAGNIIAEKGAPAAPRDIGHGAREFGLAGDSL